MIHISISFVMMLPKDYGTNKSIWGILGLRASKVPSLKLKNSNPGKCKSSSKPNRLVSCHV